MRNQDETVRAPFGDIVRSSPFSRLVNHLWSSMGVDSLCYERTCWGKQLIHVPIHHQSVVVVQRVKKVFHVLKRTLFQNENESAVRMHSWGLLLAIPDGMAVRGNGGNMLIQTCRAGRKKRRKQKMHLCVDSASALYKGGLAVQQQT